MRFIMPIYRVHKNKTHPYTIIDNTSINDKRLSAKAKGILLYLISKPDHWYTNLHNLISAFTDGERSIRTGIDELIKYGYIIRTHVRAENGCFSFYDYAVYEQPIKPTISASSFSPACRNAVLDNPVLDNSTLLNTDKKESTDKTAATAVNINKQTNAADVNLDLKNKTTETTELLIKFGIENYKKLFDMFDLNTIFTYIKWITERGCIAKNPTGFLITAIKQQWLVNLSEDSVYRDDLFYFYRCKKCHKIFGYKEPIPKFTFCNKCLK